MVCETFAIGPDLSSCWWGQLNPTKRVTTTIKSAAMPPRNFLIPCPWLWVSNRDSTSTKGSSASVIAGALQLAQLVLQAGKNNTDLDLKIQRKTQLEWAPFKLSCGLDQKCKIEESTNSVREHRISTSRKAGLIDPTFIIGTNSRLTLLPQDGVEISLSSRNFEIWSAFHVSCMDASYPFCRPGMMIEFLSEGMKRYPMSLSEVYSLLASSNSLSRSLIDIINVRQAFVQIYLTGDQMLKLTSVRSKENTKRNQQKQPSSNQRNPCHNPPRSCHQFQRLLLQRFVPVSFCPSPRCGAISIGKKGNELRLQPTSPPVVARVHHPRCESQCKDVSNVSVKELLVHPKAGKQNW